MTLKAGRVFSLVAGAFLLASCAGSGGSWIDGSEALSAGPAAAFRPDFPTPARSGDWQLYVASASPYFFSAYDLPLHNGEAARLTESGVNEPVPVADDGHNLFVGSFDDGTIYTYSLPLGTTDTVGVRRAPSVHAAAGIPSGLAYLSGLAVTGGRLYVAGDAGAGYEVFEYKLPLTIGERPSGSIGGFPPFDFVSLAARNGILYVASTAVGTVGAYGVPLRKGEKADYTIETVPQINGATGVAVDKACNFLFVSIFTLGDVYEYSLPYHAGEAPTKLDVASQAGASPYGIAVGEGHLFVTAGSILSYRIPFASGTFPEAKISFGGFAAGIAAGN